MGQPFLSIPRALPFTVPAQHLSSLSCIIDFSLSNGAFPWTYKCPIISSILRLLLTTSVLFHPPAVIPFLFFPLWQNASKELSSFAVSNLSPVFRIHSYLLTHVLSLHCLPLASFPVSLSLSLSRAFTLIFLLRPHCPPGYSLKPTVILLPQNVCIFCSLCLESSSLVYCIAYPLMSFRIFSLVII